MVLLCHELLRHGWMRHTLCITTYPLQALENPFCQHLLNFSTLYYCTCASVSPAVLNSMQQTLQSSPSRYPLCLEEGKMSLMAGQCSIILCFVASQIWKM
ncbi:hypothetical protein AVEN_221378-1 [Araneus ventricosus]|uniref:Uncharacterized protein n=1 Tax=Araneus ventricosus TaxID=182803 RepID=A0A4Y2KRK8_ARAVE|nr:hypothetical protein AVEN_221378-1 [Araneus ventricosus]